LGYPPADLGYPSAEIGYPPLEIGYPPAEIGYPPAEMGYPPPSLGYPPLLLGYPQPAVGYPPLQDAFAPQGDGAYTPPYYPPPQEDGAYQPQDGPPPGFYEYHTPPKKPSKVVSFFHSLIPPIIYFGGQAVVAFCFVFVDMLSLAFRVMESDEDMNVVIENYIQSPSFGRTVILALFFSAILGIGALWLLNRRKKEKSYVPERRRGALGLLALAVVIGLAGNFAVTFIVTPIQNFFGTDYVTSTLDNLVEGVNLPLTIVAVCFLVPIAEELCFRWLMMNRLLRAYPFWVANIIQAIIFGVMHGAPIQIAYAFLFGLLLGWIVHKTGRLSAVIVTHIAFNSAAIPLALIPNIDAMIDNTFQLIVMLLLPALVVLVSSVVMLGAATGKRHEEIPAPDSV
jgi:membrane protease YdiL (CAAX protease family)